MQENVHTPQYVQLHNHSEYSLLDGAIRIQSLVKWAKDHGQKSVALTDHGNFFGAVDFYKAAKAADINPIIGCEVLYKFDDSFLSAKSTGTAHLVLLAKTMKGYKHLIKLVSDSYLNNHQDPFVTKEELKEHSEDVIALSLSLIHI